MKCQLAHLFERKGIEASPKKSIESETPFLRKYNIFNETLDIIKINLTKNSERPNLFDNS